VLPQLVQVSQIVQKVAQNIQKKLRDLSKEICGRAKLKKTSSLEMSLNLEQG